MNWTELIKSEMEDAYRATDGLMAMVYDSELTWKPATGSNWMSTGQLLRHCSDACGMACKGFVTGDWGLPPEVDINNLKPEEMLPPAEKMPTIESVEEARRLLAEDKALGLQILAQAGEERLDTEIMPAPWDPTPRPLGQHLLGMVYHLGLHKTQLFYYLKLQGKPVNTMHLYGVQMPS